MGWLPQATSHDHTPTYFLRGGLPPPIMLEGARCTPYLGGHEVVINLNSTLSQRCSRPPNHYNVDWELTADIEKGAGKCWLQAGGLCRQATTAVVCGVQVEITKTPLAMVLGERLVHMQNFKSIVCMVCFLQPAPA